MKTFTGYVHVSGFIPVSVEADDVAAAQKLIESNFEDYEAGQLESPVFIGIEGVLEEEEEAS